MIDEHTLALLQASEAAPPGHFAAVAQLDWEEDIDWGTQQPSNSAASTDLHLQEPEDENAGAGCELP